MTFKELSNVMKIIEFIKPIDTAPRDRSTVFGIYDTPEGLIGREIYYKEYNSDKYKGLNLSPTWCYRDPEHGEVIISKKEIIGFLDVKSIQIIKKIREK